MTDQADFALTLHRVAVPDPSANACWSPFSVASALALAREAARGETRTELDGLLGDFDASDALDVPELAVANTLWADDDLTIDPGFSLAGSVRRTAFSDPATVRKLVNTDVAETTRGLITDLLTDPPPPDAAAIIVNALYLKVGWLNAFSAFETAAKPFHAPGGDVDVPTMKVTEKFRYARHDGWQTIVLPADSGVEAVVLLPDESLEQPLSPSVLTAQDFTRLELSMPKVDVRAKFTLKDTLRQQGVERMFARDADFSGLSPDERMFVDDVVHEAVLRLDEEGLEGAAATAVTFRTVSMEIPVDPIVVTVDRPFLVAVRHARSGAIYFLAQVATP
ncbi:serpin family protein [Lentzea flaviverrucosa]|uniref:Serpin B n=1 Tax=Lentzea flaviverrucosa TaxID=200379 RepID=A0A1H9XIQ7_9PSEU|nr:serpin family protein [Lentzea flaviverrucosa]RDI20233.1 serpin B [Lentzea flaviverrucosa]SES46078.1 serpin B [Lentzea flaviverrucosa]